jgi:hypothetical protein
MTNLFEFIIESVPYLCEIFLSFLASTFGNIYRIGTCNINLKSIIHGGVGFNFINEMGLLSVSNVIEHDFF